MDISIIIMWIGFLATIYALYLTFIMFRSPIKRLRKYLRKTKKWEKVFIDSRMDHWCYKDHPEFTLEEGKESKSWGTAKESWMKDYVHPTKSSHSVIAKVNGQSLLAEEFVVMDEGKIFVPLPKLMKAKNSKNKYYYNRLQFDLAKIVSIHDDYKTVEKFMIEHDLVANRGG